MKEHIGLTTRQAETILQKNGPNSIPLQKTAFIKKVFLMLISPVSLMLIVTAGVSFFLGRIADFSIIIFLFLSNILISLFHEAKADKSIEKLQHKLAVQTKVLRDGVWKQIDSTMLVVGDIIQLSVGKIITADAMIIDAENLTVNESVLTGESFPALKKQHDDAYSGSFVVTGSATAKVIATGGNTFFGKTISSIDTTVRKSSLEKDILSISKFIATFSVIVVVILSIVLFVSDTKLSEIILLDLSLLIAGIPVALPTVMSLIISVGVFLLSKKNVIVRRLASLEDLANVNMLLTDKTGTLTENKIQVENVVPLGDYSEKELMQYALCATSGNDVNPLETAITQKSAEYVLLSRKHIKFIPADSERKRSTSIVNIDDKDVLISLGASQVIFPLCKTKKKTLDLANSEIVKATEKGYRVMALAIKNKSKAEKDMNLIGLLFFADTLRADAPRTINALKANGISVKMLTGDSFEISQHTAKKIGLSGEMYDRDVLDEDSDYLEKIFEGSAGFSEVLPKDKYNLVKLAQRNYIVAVTGDGINDLPAVRTADVGFAVSNAVDALKSSADIVLLSGGISLIEDSIIEARKIFSRLYNYSVYRISESLRIIITIALIGIIYKTYPLTPIQIIILAFLNDVPIITLAFDRVKKTLKPAHVDVKRRFILSSLFGLVGVFNSMFLLFLMLYGFHFSWDIIQSVFFLKLAVSGHMLIYVAHTEEVWYKFLPSKQVIWATTITQILATLIVFFGLFTTKLSIPVILFVWVWAFGWMQVAEIVKHIRQKVKENSKVNV